MKTDKNSQINYAFVGCGRVAQRHAEAVQAAPHAQLVAVCDLDEKRAKEKSEAYQIPQFLNYHEMLSNHPEIDIVSIITPSGSHFEHAMDIIQTHKKHVLIEKPFVMSIDQGIQLKNCADKHGVRIFPIFQNRYNKAVQRVKKALVEGGDLGNLRVGTVRLRWCRPQRYYDLSPWRGTWTMDGGALTNQGIHYIDLLRYLCGEIKRVHAKTATLGASIEVDDTVVATLEFENGALGVIEIMTSARYDDFEASISCVCSEGLAVISGFATNELITYSPDPKQEKENSEVFPTIYGLGHNVMVEEIAKALLNNGPAPIEFEDGFNTIRLLHAIYRSDETDGWISLDDENIQSDRLGRSDEKLYQLYRTPALGSNKPLPQVTHP